MGILSVLTILAGAAAVLTYFLGVRPGRSWGQPTFLALVVCTLGLALLQFAGGAGGGGGSGGARYESLQWMGESLQGELSQGAKILIFRRQLGRAFMPAEDASEEGDGEVGTDQMIAERRNEAKRAFERGFGAKIELVGFELPQFRGAYSQSAAAFNRVFEQYREAGIDLWVSLVGMPLGRKGELQLASLVCQDWDPKPMGMVDLQLPYETATLRDLLKGGLIDGVVPGDAASRSKARVITVANLSDLDGE